MDLNQYFHTFGHDKEVSEKKQKKIIKDGLQDWLTQYGTLLCLIFDRAMENAALLRKDGEILAEKAFLYALLSGAAEGQLWNRKLSGGGVTIPAYQYLPYHQLLEILFENRVTVCSCREAAGSIDRKQPLYEYEGKLGQGCWGLFWKELAQNLPACEENEIPEPLEDLLDSFSQAYVLFQGEITEETRKDRLFSCLKELWKTQPPKGNEKAEEAASGNWDLYENRDVFRAMLMEQFPEIRAAAARSEEAEIADLFEMLYPRSPGLVIEMWKFLLNQMEGQLSDPEMAEQLILEAVEFLWNGSFSPDLLVEVLKKDDRFARQIFGSAYVAYPQEELLEACADRGEKALQQHLEGILRSNPAFHGFF